MILLLGLLMEVEEEVLDLSTALRSPLSITKQGPHLSMALIDHLSITKLGSPEEETTPLPPTKASRIPVIIATALREDRN